jgi:hypothetical protein
MIRNSVYGINDVTSFTEEDFKNALELNKELAKNSVEKNQKLLSELDRLETGCGKWGRASKHEPVVSHEERPLKPDTTKKSFYNYGVFFKSEEAPGVYKLSGDLSTFDQQDLMFNQNLPQRELSDYLELQRRKCIDELSNKDLLKNPFVSRKEQEPVPKIKFVDDSLLNIPKPPPKWKKYTDKDGDVYYFNVKTKATQWDKPEEYDE